MGVQDRLIPAVFTLVFSSETFYHLQKWHEPGQQVLGELRWCLWGDKDLEGSGGGAAADRGLCCALQLRPQVGLMLREDRGNKCHGELARGVVLC